MAWDMEERGAPAPPLPLGTCASVIVKVFNIGGGYGVTEPEADIITVGHDVPEVAGSPIRRSSSEIYGGGAAVHYEGDVSDSDCESVEDRERDIGVVLLFEMDTVGFLMIRCLRLYSAASCFGMRTLPSRHECSRIAGMCLYWHYRVSLIQ